MRAYPLIRRTWSNEHMMAMLFVVILLYLIPRWVIAPAEIMEFIIVLAVALLIDTAAGFFRYKRLVCSISAAITTGVLQVITPDTPLWGRLIGIIAAIVLGKVLWGGTGRNTLNPAILGYLAIYLLFSGGYAPIAPSVLLIPALVLSLPFILFRPFASIGLIGGIALSILIMSPTAGLMAILANCLFFGCVVITDPVTTTPLKLPGLIGGFAAGFIPLNTANPALNFALSILIFNLLSFLIDDLRHNPIKRPFYNGLVIKKTLGDVDYDSPAIDLSGKNETAKVESFKTNKSVSAKEHEIPQNQLPSELSSEQIITRISENDVYGSGGAAFPTADKIKAILTSNADKKYLIINGVECDPGLVHDKWLLRNRTEELYKGIEAICRCIGFSEVILAVKDPAGLKFSANIRLQQVENYYPAGYEKLLIRNVLNKRLSDGAIPSREGILVLNVQTLLMIHEAVFLNQKISCKYITVSNMRSKKSATVKVRNGDSITKVIDSVYPGQQPVFTGGGVMQAHMADEDSIIEKETNFIAVSSMPRYKESPFCSNCGACEAHCPQGLRVGRISSLVDEGKMDETVRYKPEGCIKCGICSYVCPGGRNLSARVSEAKAWSKNKAAG